MRNIVPSTLMPLTPMQLSSNTSELYPLPHDTPPPPTHLAQSSQSPPYSPAQDALQKPSDSIAALPQTVLNDDKKLSTSSGPSAPIVSFEVSEPQPSTSFAPASPTDFQNVREQFNSTSLHDLSDDDLFDDSAFYTSTQVRIIAF